MNSEWNENYLRDLASAVMSAQPHDLEILSEVMYGLLTHIDGMEYETNKLKKRIKTLEGG